MTRFQNHPVFDREKVGVLQEVFNHTVFINGTPEEKKNIMLKSSESKYLNELDFPIDNYFGFELQPILKGKDVLDLGCLVGGRSVAWFERYGLKTFYLASMWSRFTWMQQHNLPGFKNVMQISKKVLANKYLMRTISLMQ